MTDPGSQARGDGHPDGEALRRFAQGRLGRAEMARVEGHLARCDDCCRAVLAAPEDRLVGLLRRRDVVGLMLALVLAGLVAGCGPRGVGDVKVGRDPNARPVGATPRPPTRPGPVRPNRPGGVKKSGYHPG